MRIVLPAVALICCLAASLRAEDVDGRARGEGLNVQMFPTPTQEGAPRRGFRVLDRRTSAPDDTFARARELADYARALRGQGPMNGIWVQVGDERIYSEADRQELESLVVLCREREIPVYRLYLPTLSGWTRLE